MSEVEAVEAVEAQAQIEKMSKEPKKLDIRAVITVTARLAQLLAEEVDLLADMKVSKN